MKQMKKRLIPITKSHQKHRSENAQIYTTMSIKKELLIGDSMVKFVKSENLSDQNYIANIRTNPGCTIEDIADYIKPIIRRKPDIILIHIGTNDLTNSVITMKKGKQ